MISLRTVLAFAVMAVGLRATPVYADGQTWCVGGFKWSSADPTSMAVDADACSSEQKNRGLTSWHWHDNWLVTKDGKSCYQCWDMTDNTCSDQAPAAGWRQITLKECRDMGPAPVSRKIFNDPGHKWNPADDPMVVVPLEDPIPPPRKPPPDNAVVQAPSLPQPDTSTTVIAPPVVTPPPDNGTTVIVPPVVTPPPDTGVTTQPPPTPRKPAGPPLNVQVAVRVSPGPYAINDPVTMAGSASTSTGPRAVSGGFFQFFTPDGQPVTGPDGKPVIVQGKPGPKGTVVATAPAPRAGSLIIKYTPGGIEVRQSESLIKPPPGQATVEVAQCRLRGVVVTPVDGELIAATASLKLQLRGRFETGPNAPSSDLRGATPFFAVEIDGKEQRITANASGTEYTGEIEVQPPETDTANMTIKLFGEGGNTDVCAGPTSNAQLTKLGMAIDVKAKQATCYIGKACPLEAKFKFPSDPATHAQAEKLATASDLELIVRRNASDVGTLAIASPGDPSTLMSGTFVPASPGLTEVEVVARSKSLGREITGKAQLKVKDPIELKLPAELDLGTVNAGTGWPAGCTVLDFTNSRGVVEETFAMKSTVPQGCKSTPALLANGLGAPLPAGLEVTMDYDTRQLKICIADVPRCADENPAPVELTITPKNPDFPDQVRTIKVKWKVAGRSFFACHWWWIVAALGGLGLLLVGYGFVKPYNFSAHDALKMASDRAKLTRAVGRRLRELPGGRSGWYRDAATGLREDGSTTTKLSHASVTLHARKGDVILKSRGGLQRVHPQSKKLEALDTGKDGVPASKGVIYVIGDLHFSID